MRERERERERERGYMQAIGVLDERDLFSFSDYECPGEKGKCRDKIQCISLDNFCDGHEDCHDKSDEDNDYCRGQYEGTKKTL